LDVSTLALQAVGGFVVGGLIGYALRKAAKWLLIAVGFMLLPVFGLWYLGLLNVNWEGVNELVGRLIEWLGINLSNTVTAVTTAGAFGVSTVVGFLVGLTGLRHTAFIYYGRKFVRRRKKWT